jgi:heptosyltransferase I
MLGFLGDILIASPLPARIKRDDPEAHITWLVDDRCAPLARLNPYVDRVMVFDWESALQLMAESYDLVLNFERRPSVAGLVERIRADRKAGLSFGTKDNALYPINDAARHFFLMNVWNDYRSRRNEKRWVELYFECAGYRYAGEPYEVAISVEADARVRNLLVRDSPERRICLNLGGSFDLKMWPEAHWIDLGRMLVSERARVVVTGGPKEYEQCHRVVRGIRSESAAPASVVFEVFTIEEFCAVPRYCDVVVTGDSFGFHAALAQRCPCVLLLGPSRGDEVIPRGIDNVVPITASLPCAPCAHQISCGGRGGCMDTIRPPAVFHRVMDLCNGSR